MDNRHYAPLRVRGMSRVLPLLLIAAVAASVAACAPSAGTPSVPPATATPLMPTPTPNLVLQAPHVIGAWLSPVQNGPCEGICQTLSFTAPGPFDIVVTCDGYQQFSGSYPTVDYQLFDANGHQADAFHRQCGDPNVDKIMSFVVPEQQPAGTYQLIMHDWPWQCSITILAAMRS